MSGASTSELFLKFENALSTLTESVSEIAKRVDCELNVKLCHVLNETAPCIMTVPSDTCVLQEFSRSTSSSSQCNAQPAKNIELGGTPLAEVPVEPAASTMGEDVSTDVIQKHLLLSDWEYCDPGHAQDVLQRLAHRGSRRRSSVLSHASSRSSSSASSASCKQDGAKNSQRPPCLILHPQSWQRLVWDSLSIALVLHGFIILPLAAFNLSDDNQFMNVGSWASAVFWTADIAVSFRSGYFVGVKVQMDPIKIALKYSKSWLIVDVLVVSTEWISHAPYLEGALDAGRVNRLLRLSRLTRLARGVKLANTVHKMELAMSSQMRLLGFSVLKLGSLLMLAVHFLCCGWYAAGDTHNGWVTKSDFEKGTFWEPYLSSARWTLAQINGRTDQVEERTLLEKLYTCTCAMFTILIMSLFVSAITTKMMQLRGIMDEQMEYMRALNTYIDKYQISWNTAFFARKHAEALHSIKTYREEETRVLKLLPDQLQTEILFEVRSPSILRHPFFLYVSSMSDLLRPLCRHAVKIFPARSAEMIFSRRSKAERMIFVANGELKYSTGERTKELMTQWVDEEVQTSISKRLSKILLRGKTTPLKFHLDGYEVKPGMWVSEAALWLQWRNKGDLVAVDDCHLMGLTATDLVEAAKQYPDVLSLCGLYAQVFCDTLGDQSDLLCDFPPPDIEHFCVQCFAGKHQPLEADRSMQPRVAVSL